MEKSIHLDSNPTLSSSKLSTSPLPMSADTPLLAQSISGRRMLLGAKGRLDLDEDQYLL
jgi:hypothetical protein